MLGLSVRAAGIPRFDLRLLYYAFCLGCAALCQWRPGVSPLVGMAESVVNLFLLLLSVMLPIFNAVDAVTTGAPVASPMDAGKLINVMLSGTMLVFSFYRNQEKAARRGFR